MRKTRKSAQGAGTIRKRTDGRWEARFTTGFDPASGARPLRRLVRRQVEDPIAEAVLAGKMAAGDRLKLQLEENTLVISVEKE